MQQLRTCRYGLVRERLEQSEQRGALLTVSALLKREPLPLVFFIGQEIHQL